MNPERTFYNQPIRSLQTMLRTIALFSDAYERIVPDGIYGPETQTAISTFQRKRGLPVTGITLPFFSSGGSSLLVTCCMCGLLLNISYRNSVEEIDEE